MNEEEIRGRLNGLSMAVEVALTEVLTLKHGKAEEGVKVATRTLESLIDTFHADLPDSDFRQGSVDSLRLIVDRLQGIFGTD